MTKLSVVWPEVERVARAHGAVAVGAASLDAEHAALFDQWLADGHHASMRWLERHAGVRRDPQARYPWAKSAIVLLVPYSPTRPDAPPGALSHHIARYALGDDYHDVLDRILRDVEAIVAPHGKSWRYVDTGPLSDRALAARAGLGWIAKNAMLISQQHGSYTFIGTLLTALDNDIDASLAADRCGTCTRCLDACPTEAIRPGRIVDSARCISYATIEHRGPLDEPVASHLSGNAFGCDICQEVCPWNDDSTAPHPSFAPRVEYRATPVTDLLRFEQADFSALFRKSAVKRAKLDGMKRNVAALRGRREGGENRTMQIKMSDLPEAVQERLRKGEVIEIVDDGGKVVGEVTARGKLTYHPAADGGRFFDFKSDPHIWTDEDVVAMLREDRDAR